MDPEAADGWRALETAQWDAARAAFEAALLLEETPGGRIGLVNWTPEGQVGELLKVMGRYLPPPPDYGPTVKARERLTAEGRWEECRAEIVAVADRRNEASDGSLPMFAEYLVAVGHNAP